MNSFPFPLYVLLASVGAVWARNMVLTPFGTWPEECIRKVARGHMVRIQKEGALEVVRKADGVVVERSEEANQSCIQHARKMLENRRQKKQEKVADGWLDYVEYYTTDETSKTLAGFFEGTYTVPEDPPSGNNGQTLFYFIGTENLDADGESVTILQPVLTWENGNKGWNMASWNCCPRGETTVSDSILHLEAGDTVYGNISIDYTNEIATVFSQYEDDAVDLSISGELREFDWLDVTQEVYSVSSCSDFAASDTIIKSMSIKDQDGNDLIPDWDDATGKTACDGSQTFTTTDWSVHHDNSVSFIPRVIDEKLDIE
mmetsp:Transcript_6291/g.8827  ORF Transcript_6291/g.8827 Transcript_6291/m.8827 type:complete len:316 (+) Transcript_6291:35-982(+)|eukprot:CAMPEP_0197317774 /NCGR_PEP_ID=MMETSP0891-20130614/48391_1 /TAXON_ID=44058 ORGANISM="Aureoumbra lagunensis, Strain CCMP1510" /NCGR_SAMPLE_ID=MMETSP0891 /ASSEMBLY_ACC=CAM_ASM_000534 /LENGTH=315 /DNA_ID=CAMNT_0042807925 /DNA_START=1 /DNA_END=948 /DNA_ORIENTATION=+